ncbi:hypothetical protein TRFO_32797 [Tritrichomonas foetus]|uniref:UDENN domain-containing protein n=1 Tax=Tritrichomonas foetus TaxID=1144522 RepID=A0A1J4JT90_9EUKA|nr:hypothetical protein TRFO_32797 [Tritrichomonas foetus]|eukprot:OHT00485.1 hypothetical protein TRFO_32797 [Tritrichomonas foetus]
MKSTGFVLFEFDDNDETLITFVYPSADKELKTVIQETASFLINLSHPTLYTAYGSKYLYFETKRNSNRSSNVRIFGICLLADNLYPPLYSEFAQVLLEIYHDHSNPPRVLRSYLSSMTDGQLSYQGLEFASDNFEEEAFNRANFNALIERTGSNIAAIWQALVTGKTVGVYSQDINLLQQCAFPILALCSPGTRSLLPLVLESSSTMTDAADNAKHPIWCSNDSSILNNRFDICINLSQKTVVASQAFQKELNSDLLDSFREELSEAAASESSLYEAVLGFNTNNIVATLATIKERRGDCSPASIAGVNLPAETKALLTGIAQAGIIPI